MLHLLPEYCCAIGMQNEIQYAQIVQHTSCIPTFSSLARFVLYSLKACFFSFIFFNAPYLGSLTIILIALSHDEFDGTSYSQYITTTFSITSLVYNHETITKPQITKMYCNYYSIKSQLQTLQTAVTLLKISEHKLTFKFH